MENSQESWVGMREVSSYLGVTPETVRSYIQDKGLPASKVGARWKFRLSKVEEWAETGFVSEERESPSFVAVDSEVKLIQGDCISSMREIESNSIDLILTDPPYNLGLFMQDRDTNLKRMRENFFGAAGWDNLEYEEWALSMDAFFEESARVLKKGGAMIVFMAVIKVESIIQIAQRHGLYYKTTGTWHKLNPMPRNMNLHFINSTECWIYFVSGARTGTFNNNGKALHDFVETSVTPKSERAFGKHPTQKPVELMKHFVEILTNAGETVLDPFMGSGSTGVAAQSLGRDFIGIELDKAYCEIAAKRMNGGVK